jgi:hypothetical protein
MKFPWTFVHQKLTGTIPSELGNHLEGTIPSEFGELTSMFWIHLNWNVSGHIETNPNNECCLTSLTPLTASAVSDGSYSIRISQNDIFNRVAPGPQCKQKSKPYIVRALHCKFANQWGLYMMRLALQELTGTIPDEVARLHVEGTTFEILNVTGNLLTGTVPQGLCADMTLWFDCSNLLCGCDCPC